MIQITKHWIWINSRIYEILDEWVTPTSNDFVKNSFYYSDGHGDGRIELEKDYDKFLEFFNIDFEKSSFLEEEDYEEERNFILFKKDLDNYFVEVEEKFINPPNRDIYFKRNAEENYEAAKAAIKEEFKDLKNEFKYVDDEFKSIENTVFEFKMACKKDRNQGLFLRHESSRNEKYYELLRRIAIPSSSFLFIYKLRKNNKIIYYLKLSSNEIRTFENLYGASKELIIKLDTEKQLWASLDAGQNIILTGVPGTGKTHLATTIAEEVMGENGYVLTTATSDWTTFDTIGGLIPKGNGELVFREGKFLQAIRENKWLIIDEINRADIDKAFGQLFTVLSGQDVELPYYIKGKGGEDSLIPIQIKSCDDDSFYDEKTSTYHIGKNWRIIGTMNSYDKNALFDLSYAFMRRFMIIEVGVPKNLTDFIRKLKNEDGEIIYDKFSSEFKSKFESLYSINAENNNIDRKLGPAIFLDSLKYIYHRMDLEGNECLEDEKYKFDNKIFSEALIAYIIPQFEGLGSNQREEVEKFLNVILGGEYSKLVSDKLKNMQSYFI